jgi:hypothetical protein
MCVETRSSTHSVCYNEADNKSGQLALLLFRHLSMPHLSMPAWTKSTALAHRYHHRLRMYVRVSVSNCGKSVSNAILQG